MKLTYIYDTLCGWCFVAHGEIDTLRKNLPETADFEIIHRRLFHGSGEMTISPDMLDMVRRVGQQIGPAKTGARISDAYIEYLQKPGTRYDSDLTARAVAAVRALDRELEISFSFALQKAVFEKGIDFNSSTVIADLFAAETGRSAHDFLDLIEDQDMATRVADDSAAAYALMHAVGSNGVPCLVLQDGDRLIELDPYDATSVLQDLRQKAAA